MSLEALPKQCLPRAFKSTLCLPSDNKLIICGSYKG